MYNQWAPYVPVAERRRKAAAEMAQLAKKGHAVSPVRIEGRAIATTAWGKAWCANLERYSDYSNRLPRGRTYVRNGSVVHLHIAPGTVEAKVSGSSIYRTTITVKPLAAAAWTALCRDCAGGIDTLVELLQGRFASGVMERLCRHGDGLFPAPADIRFDCSCPDSAAMCKHVAAVLYGVGARFDHQPELLFALRQVDASALLASAGEGLAATGDSPRALATSDIGGLFGLEMEVVQERPAPPPEPPAPGSRPARRATRAAPESPPKRATPTMRGTSATRTQKRDPAAMLLAALRQHGVLDNGSGRAATGLDGVAVRTLLQGLVAAGHARVVGRKRGTRYVLARR